MGKQDEREARLAAALRENLRRRKTQARESGDRVTPPVERAAPSDDSSG